MNLVKIDLAVKQSRMSSGAPCNVTQSQMISVANNSRGAEIVVSNAE